ncbi:MAG: hypothetical protein PVG49_05240 [Desulfobacteraceae bacterium]|jgi:hypothetical protein
MKRSSRMCLTLMTLCLLAAGPLLGGRALAEDHRPRGQMPEGVYIEMSKDFYETLREEAGRGTRVYSNDPSDEYLRQIAVSARFMVQTNLEILRQQEAIQQMLRRLLEKQ